MNKMSQSKMMPSNPLGVIALFVFFIEVIATVSLRIVVNTSFMQPLVYFIIFYPIGITLLFFFVLLFKREVLFGPMDFREDRTFKEILMRKVEVLEAKQDAKEIEVITDLKHVYNTIDKLIAHSELQSAITVGRTFLNDGQYDISYDLFQHIQGQISSRNEYHYMALGNIAFSLNRKGQYAEALEYLSKVESFDHGKNFFAWHAVARAYAIYKLADNRKTDEYWQALENAKARSEYKLDLHQARKFYPEIGDDLNL